MKTISQKGFTLIEMLVVILVIALLIAIAAPSFLGQSEKAYDSNVSQQLAVSLKEAKSSWLDKETYPVATDLVSELKKSEPQYDFHNYNAGANPATFDSISVSRESSQSVIMCLKSKSDKSICVETDQGGFTVAMNQGAAFAAYAETCWANAEDTANQTGEEISRSNLVAEADCSAENISFPGKPRVEIPLEIESPQMWRKLFGTGIGDTQSWAGVAPQFTYSGNYAGGPSIIGGNSQLVLANTSNAAITPISASQTGTYGNLPSDSLGLSEDGMFAVFSTYATNIGPRNSSNADGSEVYLKNTLTGDVTLVSSYSAAPGNYYYNGRSSISQDGNKIAYLADAPILAGDVDNRADAYVYDRQTGNQTLVSANGYNSISEPKVSGDGRFVFFAAMNSSYTQNVLVKYDIATGTSTDLTSGPYLYDNTRLTSSYDGSKLFVYTRRSHAANDTNNEYDMYALNTADSTWSQINTSSNGTPDNANGDIADYLTTSRDGKYIVFASRGSNLDPDDNDNQFDMFIKNTETGNVRLFSVLTSGAQTNFGVPLGAISGNGKSVLIGTQSGQFDGPVGNGATTIFYSEQLR